MHVRVYKVKCIFKATLFQCPSHTCTVHPTLSDEALAIQSVEYRGADTSLARPGRKQAAPIKSVTDKGMN
jgi:hypothetical protein